MIPIAATLWIIAARKRRALTKSQKPITPIGPTSAPGPRLQVSPALMRVTDQERDAVVTELTGHFQVGRLSQDEFDARMDRALRAVTRVDLDTLLVDLPSAAGYGVNAIISTAPVSAVVPETPAVVPAPVVPAPVASPPAPATVAPIYVAPEVQQWLNGTAARILAPGPAPAPAVDVAQVRAAFDAMCDTMNANYHAGRITVAEAQQALILLDNLADQLLADKRGTAKGQAERGMVKIRALANSRPRLFK